MAIIPIPEGYVPVFAFSLCPPSGIYFQLAVFLFDMVNDLLQIGTFLLHGDWWFGAFIAFFVLLSSLLTVAFMTEESSLKRFDPLGEARLCLARGVPTKAWEGMLGAERLAEAPSTGLIGPYGASLLQLTPLQAASCLYGLYSSAKAMAEGKLQEEVKRGADAEVYALKAVRPFKTAMCSVWYGAAYAAELAAFAVASAVLHPLVTMPGYLLGAVANGAAAWFAGSPEFLEEAIFSCLGVGLAMAGLQTNIFFKPKATAPGGAKGPGWIPALCIFVRFIAWTALCFLDLPRGLVSLGSLSRPMGLPVLRAKFLEPAAACFEAIACFTSHF
ncbi:unnamed protein product, partial [Symbiodinium necroappetens]